MEKPLYQQIEDRLREQIDGIAYEPGDQIPSERELAEALKASRMTVRRALERLTAQGYLERRSTSGTYVREPQVVRTFNPSSVQSLSRQVHGRGGDAGSKLLAFETIDAPAKVAKHLNLRINSHVLYIQRLRTASGLPFCVESSYLPAESFGALSQNELTDSGSLYEILNRRFGVLPAGSKDKLKIAWPTAEEAQWLCITTDQPVLYFRSIVFDASGKPFEFVKSINHPTRVAFFSASVIPNQT